MKYKKLKIIFKRRLSKVQLLMLTLIVVIILVAIIFFVSKNQYIIINSEENKILFDKCNEMIDQFEKNMDLITISNDEANIRWYQFKIAKDDDTGFYKSLINSMRTAYTEISPKESKIYTNAGLILKMFDKEKIKKQEFKKFIYENSYINRPIDFTYISYFGLEDECFRSILQPAFEYKYIYIDNPRNYTDLLKNEYLKLLILNNITEYLKKIS